MVYRIFVEKKPAFDQEAEALRRELTDFLGVASLTGLRVLNRYDAEGISKDLFDQAVRTVFSEPQVDTATETPDLKGGAVFAVETCRASSTSGRIPRPSASSSSPRGSGL